jgi:hypothetical protein
VQCAGISPHGSLGAFGGANGTSYSVSLQLPGFRLDQFTTGGAIPIFTHATRASPHASVLIQGNAAGASATMAVPGMATVKVAAHVAKPPNQSMLEVRPPTLLAVPISIGRSGAQTGYFYILTFAHYITVDFYGWTQGTHVFTGLTSKLAAVDTPTVSAMGSYHLVNGNGTVTLVAPTKISIDGALAQRRLASFTRLTFAFPEPSALLLAAGAGALLLSGRRRRS